MSKSTLLQHIGIIMDGNGRWAKKRKLDRTQGHLNGIQSTKASIIAALEHTIPIVSLYVFSTENWSRPRPEVEFILKMVAGNLRKHYQFYRDNNIKVVHSGNLEQLGSSITKELESVMEETKNNTAITVNLAFNYGGQDEIIRAANKYYSTNPNTPLTTKTLSACLDNPHIPPVDLIIRTGGQKRISNFLLWQAAYAELYFSDILWPDWTQQDMHDAIVFYQSQERRFGGI